VIGVAYAVDGAMLPCKLIALSLLLLLLLLQEDR